MLTRSCDVDPFISNFYVVKLGFIGVYDIFLFLVLSCIVGTR